MKISKKITLEPLGNILVIWNVTSIDEVRAFKAYADLVNASIIYGSYLDSQESIDRAGGFPIHKEEMETLEDFLALYD